MRTFLYHCVVSLANLMLMLFAMSMNMFFIISMVVGIGMGKTIVNICEIQNYLKSTAINSDNELPAPNSLHSERNNPLEASIDFKVTEQQPKNKKTFNDPYEIKEVDCGEM